MPDFGKYVSRLPASTPPELARALADVFRDLTKDGGALENSISDISTYQNSLSGSVSRTLQSRLEDSISVKDFGATGDGSTDDTSAFAAALASGAYRVRVPPGTYIISSSLSINNYQELVGDSKANCVLKATGSGCNSGIIYKDTGGDFCLISGLTVDGNSGGGATANGINLAGNTGARIIDCIVQNCSNNGITISQNGAQSVNSFYAHISRNLIREIAGHGISLSLAARCTVSENIMANVAQSGVNLALCFYCTVANNTMDSNASGTYNSSGYAGVRVTSGGSPVQAAERNSITGNSITRWSRGIFILGAQFTTITGNIVGNTYAEGILISTSSTHPVADGMNACVGNVVTYPGQGASSGSRNGILIDGQNKNTVVGNVVYDATARMEYALAALQNSYGNALHNQISGNTVGGYQTDLATATFVDRNVLGPNNDAVIGSSGPSIASASTINLPAHVDVFTVTGTTGISTINGGYVGRLVTLNFGGALTVTDGGGSSGLNLAGNFTTAAGSTLTLRYTGGQWVEVSRSNN